MTETIYSFRVGAWECFALHDGAAEFSAAEFFGGTAAAELERALAAANLAPDTLPLAINLLVASNGAHRVLIDTGIGRDVGGGEGQLLARLDSVGVKPNDIDVVAVTHGHWDHIGGLTDESGRLVFPDARHVMPAKEWTFWTAAEELEKVDAVLAQWARENLPPLADRIELLAAGDQIVPGLSAIAASGHTPGQAAYLFASDGEELLHIGDVAHHPFQIASPAINPAVEMRPGESLATRRRLLERVADSEALLMGSHFPFPGVGRVVSEADAWTWRPLTTTRDLHDGFSP